MKRSNVFAVLAAASIAAPALAAPTTIVDTTVGTAANDGTINAGEYAGSSTGINSGFGNVIGSASSLHMDSSDTGQLNIGLDGGGGSLNDAAVIYIDSRAGGFADTTALEDQADGGRSAISGDAFGSESEITFAPGFEADFAISIAAGFAGVFELTAGSYNFISSANINPGGNAGADHHEFNLLLSDIGVAQGGSFDYIATYLNSGNAFRSNEFHGVAQTTVPGDNIGQNPVILAAGDFNTFISVPEPASMGLIALGASALLDRRRKR